MYDLRVDDAILQSQVIEEIKHILDGSRQDTTAAHCTEYHLKQAVNVLLQRTLPLIIIIVIIERFNVA